MPDPAPSSSRLEDLRMRWQLEPASRIYLQLAEEYRKLDRHPEAIEVLKRGLQQRPNDLSGQVALGRCHLEMDELEPALELLEGVIDRDPAHMVGNKLLIEACLKSGAAARAGERLELYKLLNPADPDLETLEAELRRQRGAAPGVPEPGGVTTAQIPIVPRGAEEARSFPETEVVLAEEVFEISPEPESAFDSFAAEPADEDVPTRPLFEPMDEEPAAWAGATAASPARGPAYETSPASVLPYAAGADADEEEQAPRFEEPPLIDEALIGEASLDEVPLDETPLDEVPLDEVPLAGKPATLAEDELFYLGPPPPFPRIEELWGWPSPAAGPPAAGVPAVEEAPWAEVEEVVAAPRPAIQAEVAQAEEAQAEEAQAEEIQAEVAQAEETQAEETQAEETRAEETPAEEPATATLGSLYLRQGHVAEAERIFRQVLRRDPRNAAALAGLARIRGETGLTAQALLASAGERIPVGLTTKKIRLLESYMKHLRDATERHVH